MMLPIRILVIISLAAASQPQFRKHWRRAPVHGTFNVDAYAYNKPQVNLVKQLPAAGEPARMIPLGQLLEQISHSSRIMPQAKVQYRNLDHSIEALPEREQSADYLGGSSELAPNAAALAALNSQLAQLQMNLSFAHENLYSHEFHVQSMGNRKIVLLNTLEKKEHRKPESAKVTTKEKQQQPLKMELSLPTLLENEELQAEQEVQAEPITTPKQVETEAISSREAESHSDSGLEYVAGQQSEVTDANKKRVKVANSATTIEKELTAAAAGLDQQQKQLQTVSDAKQKQEQKRVQEMKNQHQLQMKLKLKLPESVVDSQNDNDGQANGMNVTPVRESKPVSVDKPLRSKSKRKQTRRKTQAHTQTKTKAPNEIDTKLTTAQSVDMLTGGTADVKVPAKVAMEISTQKPQQKGSNVRGKGKGKGKSKRKGADQEQEIEATTNWWHILPHAEIRKFLNSIYDSFTDDSDYERAQRM